MRLIMMTLCIAVMLFFVGCKTVEYRPCKCEVKPCAVGQPQ